MVLHYSHSDAGAKSAVEEIQRFGGKAAAIRADFRQLEDVRKLARDAEAFLGGLDVLINNAGITLNRVFEEVSPNDFDTLYNVNVRAQFFLTQALLPALTSKARGVVINLTSIHAFEGRPEHSVYAGTKGAIVAYTRELAIELAPKGVRVNAIAPGAVAVENHYRAIPDFDPVQQGRLIPSGFTGEPKDIAGVALFLASDAARYIVGQTIIVDGGTTSWMPFSDEFRNKSESRFGEGYVD